MNVRDRDVCIVMLWPIDNVSLISALMYKRVHFCAYSEDVEVGDV